ncbi:MAG: hypothetical protein PWQ91_786 [Eubacteriales bacterium]|nr:hypothetical protein [Eubacteriales bacterium]MDN5363725.1 hypothetical protein [Eubacteriales bacterium]
MYLNRLFVYGTLLPGLRNYHRFLAKYDPPYWPAKAKGIMYYIPDDHYPVVVDGEGDVYGVLYETKDLAVILPVLDEIEKYTGVESQSHLIREIREVENLETGEKVRAHMFLWPPSRREELEKRGVRIESGDWLKFLRERGMEE